VIGMVKSIQAPRVFISYSHESKSHNEKVFELSETLRSEGVDCYIDQYEVSPPEGWPRWSRNQIQQANFVLVVCTETYKKRFEGSEVAGTGAGAKWEGAIISQELYDSEGRNTKFIPIVFNADDVKHIPVEMRGGTYYVLDRDDEYDDLYRHLTNQPKAIKRELGRLRSLPPKKRKESFVPTSAACTQPSQVSSAASRENLPLAMFWRVMLRAIFVSVERVRSSGKTISLTVAPSSSRRAAEINNLQRSHEPIAVAYNDTAVFARLKSLEQIIEKGA
jgi:TIR domain